MKYILVITLVLLHVACENNTKKDTGAKHKKITKATDLDLNALDTTANGAKKELDKF